jgi:long-chain acyl-CoA synthetase
VNRERANRIGTVGPVLSSDIELRIAEDGEICFRGPNIARGYWKRPRATAESWSAEGWFHTGDLGSVDECGALSITGRKKEILVTAGGKKISPDAIEAKLRRSAYISQAVLVGEGKPYCCAIVTIDRAAITQWAAGRGIVLQDDYATDPRVIELIDGELAEINAGLASYESVKKVTLLRVDFSVDNGLLTPTLKVRRSEVVKRYSDRIAALYS